MAGKYEEIVRCSFCNKPQSQVRKMIAGPNGPLDFRTDKLMSGNTASEF